MDVSIGAARNSLCVALWVLGLGAGCLATTEPARLPDGQRGIRIECNYDASNCERKARDACHGDFRVVDRGDLSCERCGWESPDTGSNDSHVYRGSLVVQCM